ncbi:hypothetical protein KIK06_09280 [Nocardiopsis sp. EMB25]|uniref:hypothetical protein n=1 Tax=Nocardiopsis TaxID=2013 RepID=UPI00034CB838|nr:MULTISPECIES: hypothetical protein [Nocardiopsis]MCY9784083.1 hypothetical protein [Nocardiopsis sp. EMB25]
MFNLVIVGGVTVGLGTVFLARRAERAGAALDERQRAGELTPQAADQARLRLLRRSQDIGLMVTFGVLCILGAVLGRAVLADQWDGETLYHVVLLAGLLAWSARGHLLVRSRIARVRSRLGSSP